MSGLYDNFNKFHQGERVGFKNGVQLNGFEHQKDIFGLAINCAHSYNVATFEEKP